MASKLEHVTTLLSEWPNTFRPALSHDDVELSEIVNICFEYERSGTGASSLRGVALRDVQNRVFKVTASYGLAAFVSCKGTKTRWRVYGTFMDKVKIDEAFDNDRDARERMIDLQGVHYGAGTTLYCEQSEVDAE